LREKGTSLVEKSVDYWSREIFPWGKGVQRRDNCAKVYEKGKKTG